MSDVGDCAVEHALRACPPRRAADEARRHARRHQTDRELNGPRQNGTETARSTTDPQIASENRFKAGPGCSGLGTLRRPHRRQ